MYAKGYGVTWHVTLSESRALFWYGTTWKSFTWRFPSLSLWLHWVCSKMQSRIFNSFLNLSSHFWSFPRASHDPVRRPSWQCPRHLLTWERKNWILRRVWNGTAPSITSLAQRQLSTKHQSTRQSSTKSDHVRSFDLSRRSFDAFRLLMSWTPNKHPRIH